MTEHRVLLVVDSEGAVGGALVGASCVVLADVSGLEIVHWQLLRVGWAEDAAWPADLEEHILEFVLGQQVRAIVAGAVPRTLCAALRVHGVAVFERAGISARAAAISAATVMSAIDHPGA